MSTRRLRPVHLLIAALLLGACADDPSGASAPEAVASTAPVLSESSSAQPTERAETDAPEPAGAGPEEAGRKETEPGDASSAGPSERSDGVTVDIFYLAYQPSELQVVAGVAVEWVNGDNAAHTVTFDDGEDSGTLERDGRFSRTFDQPGEHAYTCRIHPGMAGTVTVAG